VVGTSLVAARAGVPMARQPADFVGGGETKRAHTGRRMRGRAWAQKRGDAQPRVNRLAKKVVWWYVPGWPCSWKVPSG